MLTQSRAHRDIDVFQAQLTHDYLQWINQLLQPVTNATGICAEDLCIAATGSFARRDPGVRSDLDFFIIMNHASQAKLIQIRDFLFLFRLEGEAIGESDQESPGFRLDSGPQVTVRLERGQRIYEGTWVGTSDALIHLLL